MTVVSVDGVPVQDVIRGWMDRLRKYFGYSSDRVLRYEATRIFLRQPRHGAKVRLELEDHDGRTMGVEVAADLSPRYLPRLPVPKNGINDSADVSWMMLDDQIGYIYVRRIRQGLEGSLDRAVQALKGARGLIVDVRGNSGGGFDTSSAFRNFDRSPANSAEPDRPHFTGSIALLIDEGCVSAGEGWASWFIANKRARVFGTATAGASSRKETYTLKNGLYKAVVPVKAYTGFLDRPIERRGLEPDVAIRCTAKDLAQGRDTVVEAAKGWLKAGSGAR
jgi:carboxyl-terminal processing protease